MAKKKKTPKEFLTELASNPEKLGKFIHGSNIDTPSCNKRAACCTPRTIGIGTALPHIVVGIQPGTLAST